MKSTLVVIAIALSSAILLRAQDTTTHHGIAKDWITHHVIFSNPGTRDQAIQNGTYERWLRIVNDPRYIMQQTERSLMASAPSSAASDAVTDDGSGDDSQPAPTYNGTLPHGLAKALIAPSPLAVPETKLPSHGRLKKDWSEGLTATSGTAGAAGATTGLGEFPATFTTGGTACTDFAIYNTGLAGASGQASIVAYNNIYSTCNSGVPTVTWAFNTGGTIVNSIAFDVISCSTVCAQTGTQGYFVQTNSSGAAQLVLLTWNAGSGTAVSSPVAPTSVTAANYSTCTAPCMTTLNLSGTGPALTTATGTFVVTGTVGTSWAGNTVSINGTTYTFVTGTPTAINQIELHTASSSSTNKTDTAKNLEAVINANSSQCTSGDSCLPAGQTANSAVTATESTSTVTLTATAAGTAGNFTLASSNTSDVTASVTNGTNSPLSDTYSAPYYDPTTDTIYVGDDVGNLHKFTPVFNGTLAEVTTGGWPLSVNASASLGSPVYDTGSLNVFVGDYPLGFSSLCQPNTSTTISPCGYLYSVSSSGTVTKSAELDFNNGIIDSPIVDSSVGMVYAFAGQDNSTSCALPPLSTGSPCAGVYQFATNFGSGATGTEAQVGAGSQFMMSGAFDNAYFTTGTGNLYVVGNTGPANNTLYQIPITSGVITPPANAGPAVSTNYTSGYYAAGLQVTEYLNGGADYVFLSVLAFGNATGCTGQSVLNGCAMGFNVTAGTISPSSNVTGALPEAGGTSGIVVDYAPGAAGNIYFSTLLNTSCTLPATVTAGCAIQTNQAIP
jgi:hypothetical protein